ncbi:type 11 methyltransferase [Gloeomargarita lithophora Alchichica-D10]|uniref:Type 11 methyltransferase n=1 Tax=Gloeomargarita lithophora Alchichica-D10 TaxID=1188229 RepID=A0A1J0ACF4_9CYAN|nr:methyltransferase domain-containing protein [Gloeomargarita lithophora]APB33613.1 type 11 methyltransferase [Gloeomargarita lithophora Alchichica-D10]
MLRKPLMLLTGVGLSLVALNPLLLPPSAHALPVLPSFGEYIAKDVPYVPTPQEVVDAMLKLGNVNSQDVLLDLGSGDGRIVITAAKNYRVQRAVGIEIDPSLVAESRRNIEQAGVADRAQIMQQNLFDADLSKYSVITMYLLPSVNLRLRHKLLRLKPGTRIVSHAFDMGGWKPDEVRQVDGRTVYLWVVPEPGKINPEFLKEIKE